MATKDHQDSGKVMEETTCTICGFMCPDEVLEPPQTHFRDFPQHSKELAKNQQEHIYPNWLRNELIRLFPEARQKLCNGLTDDKPKTVDMLVDEPLGSVAELHRHTHIQKYWPPLSPAQLTPVQRAILMHNEHFLIFRRLRRLSQLLMDNIPQYFQHSVSTFLAFQLQTAASYWPFSMMGVSMPAVYYREAYEACNVLVDQTGTFHSTPLYARVGSLKPSASNLITFCLPPDNGHIMDAGKALTPVLSQEDGTICPSSSGSASEEGLPELVPALDLDHLSLLEDDLMVAGRQERTVRSRKMGGTRRANQRRLSFSSPTTVQDKDEAKLLCGFCKKNGEPRSVYTSHGLTCPVSNVVTCPILRTYVCQACQATGDFAHTRSYCPMVKERQGSVRSATIALKATRHQSNGVPRLAK